MTPYRTPGERALGPRWGATRLAKWKLWLLGCVRPRRVLVVALARRRREREAADAESDRVREACEVSPDVLGAIDTLISGLRPPVTPRHLPGRPIDE